MDLIKARLRGFRRFVDATIDLDESVIAIVGPNEAGKSSILEALTALEDHAPFGSDLTRDSEVESDGHIVELTFVLDDEEREELATLGGTGEPRYYIHWKTPNGKTYHKIDPPYQRDRRVRASLRAELQRAIRERPPSARFDEAGLPDGMEGSSGEPGLTELLAQVDGGLETTKENLHEDVIDLRPGPRLGAGPEPIHGHEGRHEVAQRRDR